jgi:hypothetical protein
MAIAMFEKTMLLEAPLARLWGIGWAIAHPVTSLSGIALFIALPLLTPLLLRWTITGRWGIGPRW